MQPQDPNAPNSQPNPQNYQQPGETLPPVAPQAAPQPAQVPYPPQQQPAPLQQQQAQPQQNEPVQQPVQQQNVDPTQPQQMYYSRPLEPQKPVMTPAIQQKCEESKKKYPHLNLSEGEYVVNDVKRHPIGLIQIWGLVAVLVLAILLLLAFLVSSFKQTSSSSAPIIPLAGVAILLASLAVIGGYIGAYVYKANRFYLTNESVTQNIQMGLFANREQTVSLGNVEDASYSKHGIIQAIFDYGTIRLSTQGDETTYRFNFASHPSQQVAKLNDAVEAFKNGRPVDDDE